MDVVVSNYDTLFLYIEVWHMFLYMTASYEAESLLLWLFLDNNPTCRDLPLAVLLAYLFGYIF